MPRPDPSSVGAAPRSDDDAEDLHLTTEGKVAAKQNWGCFILSCVVVLVIGLGLGFLAGFSTASPASPAGRASCSAVDANGDGFCTRYSPDYHPNMFELYPPLSPDMSDAEVKSRMDAIPWVHNIEMRPGIKVSGTFKQSEWPGYLQAVFPQDMTGMTAIDIGPWDGFFSFHMESLGASVTSIDYCCWEGRQPAEKIKKGWKSDCCWGNFEGYRLAHAARRSKNKAIRLNVYDFHPALAPMVDVVYFAGVLYHLKHPYLALERAASVTKRLLIVETHFVDLQEDMTFTGKISPAFMELYPGSELADDSTNENGVNEPALEGMLLNLGFTRVKKVFEFQQRKVIHAWK